MPAKTYDWLDPLNKLIWRNAFKQRATSMTLRDGRVFTIKYSKREIRSLDVREAGLKEMAWVKGPSLAAPCGWFKVEDVLDPLWVSSNG